MQLVDNDTFLKQLANVFELNNKKGTSVWLTHKRLTYDGGDTVMVDAGENGTKEYPCLIRVADGQNTKLSTRVDPGQLDKFHAAYGTLLKASMTSLRKRDKKREKERQERIAMRKKQMAEPVIIEGPKRGKGRRKRQRAIKAGIKQEEARKKEDEKQKQKKSS